MSNIYKFPKDTGSVVWNIPLSGRSASELFITGSLETVAANQVATYATDFAVRNNHVFILINTVTAAGTITITGTSIDEETGCPVTSDTEVITPTETNAVYYQSNKKWWEVTNVAVVAGAIDYDIGIVGYSDVNNQSFELLGYRLEMEAAGVNPDISFRILKIKDADDISEKRMLIQTVEHIGIDADAAGNQIVDSLRTGAADRSYNPAVGTLWTTGGTIVLKQFDFRDYWDANDPGRNRFLSSTKHEGVLIEFLGEPAGAISNIEWATLQLRFKQLF